MASAAASGGKAFPEDGDAGGAAGPRPRRCGKRPTSRRASRARWTMWPRRWQPSKTRGERAASRSCQRFSGNGRSPGENSTPSACSSAATVNPCRRRLPARPPHGVARRRERRRRRRRPPRLSVGRRRGDRHDGCGELPVRGGQRPDAVDPGRTPNSSSTNREPVLQVMFRFCLSQIELRFHSPPHVETQELMLQHRDLAMHAVEEWLTLCCPFDERNHVRKPLLE